MCVALRMAAARLEAHSCRGDAHQTRAPSKFARAESFLAPGLVFVLHLALAPADHVQLAGLVMLDRPLLRDCQLCGEELVRLAGQIKAEWW